MNTEKLDLVIGTQSKKKTDLYKIIINSLNESYINFIPLIDLMSNNEKYKDIVEPEEIYKSYIENSILKAEYYAHKLNLNTFSDDSGIGLKCLNWGPDYDTKYYLDSLVPYKSTNDYKKEILYKLIEIVNKYKNSTNNDDYRKAILNTTITLIIDGKKQIFSSYIKGYILEDIDNYHSDNFDYDCIFRPEVNNNKYSLAYLMLQKDYVKKDFFARDNAFYQMYEYLKFYAYN